MTLGGCVSSVNGYANHGSTQLAVGLLAMFFGLIVFVAGRLA